ncbi:MAG: DUF1844 domain-containing protein [Desulfosarcinaceae bacterium]|nr:DUF1844 domain-containing protein [Desulfosarcinaceae bacterium]
MSEEKGFVMKEEAETKSDATTSAEEKMFLPEINFATFVVSLNSSALMALGLVADPITKKTTKNLELAKQTIDILGMLKEKTQGNLTSDEENMLRSVLYDLRMLYVKEKG